MSAIDLPLGVFVALVILVGAILVLGFIADVTMTDEERTARDARLAVEEQQRATTAKLALVARRRMKMPGMVSSKNSALGGC